MRKFSKFIKSLVFTGLGLAGLALTGLALTVIIAMSALVTPVLAVDSSDQAAGVGLSVRLSEGSSETHVEMDTAGPVPVSTREFRARTAPALPMRIPSGVGISAEHHNFDNPVDLMYFSIFGEGFEIMQRQSSNINRTINQGNWQLELLSSIAVLGQSFPRPVWPDNVEAIITEDGIWTIVDADTGEIIDIEDLEVVETSDVNIYTFLTLRDTSGQINVGFDVQLGIQEREMTANVPFFMGHINMIYFDEETGLMYFVLQHHKNTENIGNNVSIDFGIDRILADNRTIENIIELDIADLLGQHQATFFVSDGSNIQAIGSSWEMNNILGEDFDPSADGTELMTFGELNINLLEMAGMVENFTLSNIALRDNLLMVQVREPNIRTFPSERWFNLVLIDPRVEPVDWEDIEEIWNELLATGTMEEQLDFRLNLNTMGSGRYFNDLYSITMTSMDESFPPSDMRYTERAFHIADLEVLDHINFFVGGQYFGLVDTVNFDLSITAPVIAGELKPVSEYAYALVNIEGVEFTFRNFVITTMGIHFDIEEAKAMIDRINNLDRWFAPTDYFDIYLIYIDGTEIRYNASLTSWSRTDGPVVPGSERGSDSDNVSYEFSMILGGGIIDIENLAAIRINDTLVDVN